MPARGSRPQHRLRGGGVLSEAMHGVLHRVGRDMPHPGKPESPFRYFHSSPLVIRMVVMRYVRFSNVDTISVTRPFGPGGSVLLGCLQGHPATVRQPDARFYPQVERDWRRTDSTPRISLVRRASPRILAGRTLRS